VDTQDSKLLLGGVAFGVVAVITATWGLLVVPLLFLPMARWRFRSWKRARE
jgi:hypothetical protein